MKIILSALTMLVCSWLIVVLAFASELNEHDAVQTIVGEAADQPYECMVAMGEVIRNRGSIKGFAGFEAMNHREESVNVWRNARQAWRESDFTNYAKGATLCENISAFGFPKGWDREKVVCVAQWGDISFFQEIK